MLFERWDRSRGISVELPIENHIRPAMMHLAHAMYSSDGYESGVPRDRLVAMAADYLMERRFDDLDEARAAAAAFVDFCTGRAWVFTDVGTTPAGEALYAFTHRTFLEYFTAGHLVRTHPTADGLFKVLAPHIELAEWDVVAQLALQIVNRNVEDAGDRFLGLLLEATLADRDLNTRAGLCSFGSRVLSFLVPGTNTIRSLVKVSFAVASELGSKEAPQDFSSPDSAEADGGSLVGSVLSCNSEVERLVVETLRLEIVEAVKGADEWAVDLALALDVLSFFTAPDVSSESSSRRASALQKAIFEEVGGDIIRLSRADSTRGASLIETGLLGMEQALSVYGPGVLIQARRPLRLPIIFHSPAAKWIAWLGSQDTDLQASALAAIDSLGDSVWKSPTPWLPSPPSAMAWIGFHIDSSRWPQLSGSQECAVTILSLAMTDLDAGRENRHAHLRRQIQSFEGILPLLRPLLEAYDASTPVAELAVTLAEARGLPAEGIELCRAWADHRLSFVAP